VIGAAAKLRFGLFGLELIRLAALRRVGIERDRIVVLDQAPTGDMLLDEALVSVHGSPTARHGWHVTRMNWSEGYLERLAAAGTIRLERRKALGFIPVNGWESSTPGGWQTPGARLDAIAYGADGADATRVARHGDRAAAARLPGLPRL
jgi:hypothetical protein